MSTVTNLGGQYQHFAKPTFTVRFTNETTQIYTWHTVATKINHDVSLSVHDAGESERCDIAPHFKGSKESIIYDFLIQIRSVSQDSTTCSGKVIRNHDKEGRFNQIPSN